MRSPWLSIAGVSNFPAIEQRALADQVRRASKSICANLAEGLGRSGFAPADFRRFVVMAVGSADEMRVWTRYCLDLGYIDEAVWQPLVRRVHGDLEDAAGSAQGPGAVALIAACCLLPSAFWPGSGAFRRPVKVGREAGWRYRKCTC